MTIESKIWENHWKTIKVNGRSEKKHSMVMVWWQQNHWKTIGSNGALEKNHYHPIVMKKWPSLKSNPWHSKYFICVISSLMNESKILPIYFFLRIVLDFSWSGKIGQNKPGIVIRTKEKNYLNFKAEYCFTDILQSDSGWHIGNQKLRGVSSTDWRWSSWCEFHFFTYSLGLFCFISS